MEKMYFVSKRQILEVVKKDDGTFECFKNGQPYIAGGLINSVGGLEKFEALLWNEDRFREFKKQVEKQKQFAFDTKEQRKELREKQRQALFESRERAFEELCHQEIIEATEENIATILYYLNQHNWGSWPGLPKMNIHYRCNQYDCNGKIATTMILNDGRRFVVGAPVGHLTKYSRITDI